MSDVQPRGADRPANPESLRVESGFANLIFAYDVGYSIKLDDAERLLAGARPREPLRRPRRAPQWLQFDPPPLRFTMRAEPHEVGVFRTLDIIEVVVHEFGCISITYRAPISGPLAELIGLSAALYENQALGNDARRRVQDLLQRAEPAVNKPHLHPSVEDYAVYEIRSLGSGVTPRELLRTAPREIAMLLRSEGGQLSEQEISDALSARASYSDQDLTLIDWNAALVIDPQADDVRTVLEYANIELLEMRYLDRQLDLALEEAYRALSKPRGPALAAFGSYRGELGRIARLQADSAALFEAVHNPLKLVGDQFLARVYRVASHRLHLAEWDGGILRKLQTLDSIYGKMNDQRSGTRMEILEWIIILLFIVSIVMPFFGMKH